ncbi:TonB-dependent siderophore receptor [Acidovorax sp. CF316]|uniref:TonB-dependent siderophore receptor n=1 Tax=Acidovorax sp. CF316 TaxID=1144317 RepID=UPI00026BEF18|nr:TonB-dependent siderophore receptor [Acidovorax sp. CF316]EJE50328.1 TonB-dependent siderophore receptor [Acidovorax sp. CF316]
MSVSRRQPVCRLNPLALAAIAAVLAGAAQAQDAAPAASTDQITAPKALDSVTVSGSRESASTRLQLTARETPQSTTTVTREQIERQSLTSIDAVLRNVNGVAVSFYDTQRPLYYARGFQITDFQIDGLPSYSSSTNQEYDTALYERVEIVRGANGILTGVGVPSATINMIRKRPQREFAASVALTAGSWNLYRGELDINAPLTKDGSVRSRLVIAPQKKDSFRDRYSEDKTALLAAIEADLGSSTVATLGYQRQSNDPKAPIWGTIPRFATNGSPIDLPTSVSFSPPWTRWERTSGTLYATLEHQLNDDWSVKAALNHTEGDTFSLRTYGYGRTVSLAPFINPTTGAGTTLYAAVGGGSEKQDTVDAYLSGKFELGGRKHDLMVGVSSTRIATRTDGYSSVANWSYVIPNIYTWDGNAPAPVYSKTGAWRTQITQQTGLFASARWRVAEPLSLLTGVRLTDWHRHSDSYGTTGAYAGKSAIQDENRKVTPYIGAVYDITPTLSAYTSYTRIFNPQNYKDRNNNPLSPVIGSNTEAGLKAELLDRRIQAHFAVFQTKQDNYGVRDGAITTPLPDGTLPYVAVNGTKSTGFELEFSGMATRQWRVSAGLTRAKVTRAATDLIYANLPEYLLQLGTDYQFSGALAPLSVGGNLVWQSSVEGFNIPHPSGTVTVKQSPTAVLGLRASWQFNPKLSATLAVNNVTNKKYWANLDYGNYSDPRNVSLTMRAAF